MRTNFSFKLVLNLDIGALGIQDEFYNVYNFMKKSSLKFSNKNKCRMINKIKAMKIEEAYRYDVTYDLLAKNKFEYDKGKLFIKDSLSFLGKSYIKYINTAFDSGWIDSSDKEDKLKGAFCLSIKEIHPFITICYKNNFESILELAHELGHAGKIYLGEYIDLPSMYKEIPSIVNELLVIKNLEKMINKQEDFIKTYKSDRIFQDIISVLIEIEFLEKINNYNILDLDITIIEYIWCNINKKYYGDSVVYTEFEKDGWIKVNWFQSFEEKIKYIYATMCACIIVSGFPKNKNIYLDFLNSNCEYKEKLVELGIDDKGKYIEKFLSIII